MRPPLRGAVVRGSRQPAPRRVMGGGSSVFLAQVRGAHVVTSLNVLSAVGWVVARKNEDMQLNIVGRLQCACFERFRSIYIIITFEEQVFTNLSNVSSDCDTIRVHKRKAHKTTRT